MIYRCKNCGAILNRNKADIKRGRINFCGPSCQTGKFSRNWKGGRYFKKKDGVVVYQPLHPRSRGGVVLEHLLIAEKALGKYLPEGIVIHHCDGNKTNNNNNNLVVCENQAYHVLLHRRLKALKQCGHANWLLCRFCHQYDSPKNMYVHPTGAPGSHRACHAEYERKRRQNEAAIGNAGS